MPVPSRRPFASVRALSLRDYCDQKHGRMTKLAKDLGVTVGLVSHWAAGQRPIPVKRALDVQIYTGGVVPVWKTRPDVRWDRVHSA